MIEAFVAGGWGMYPTLLAGLGLLGASLRYAQRPESRYVPLLVTLGLFTLLAGALGFFSGVLVLLGTYTGPLGEQSPRVLFLIGLYEALHNVALALLLTTLSALVASVGALRLAVGPRFLAPRT
ncbi:hypothetical protein F0U62_23080 [Cystobacter fuscus]|uniref:hypothetical protein n=1 Tax=Cystobacter fuscus TaxID=43 RepID=UPI002B2C049B|nr:hypothetical protein F0U62_23080 [Cystobacter fuscus]